MMNKRMLVLPVVAIIAISVVGIAYAAWSDMVTIKGTLGMGSLTLAFTDQEPPLASDNEDWDANGKIELPEKDVGSVTAYYEGWPIPTKTDVHTLKGGYEKLIIEISDAYPSYVGSVTFIVENIGTIPLICTGYEITVRDVKEDKDLVKDPTTGAWVYFDDPAKKPILNISIVDLTNKQIEPEDDPATDEIENKAKAEIDIHPKQDARQCHTYKITLKVLCVQWNKA